MLAPTMESHGFRLGQPKTGNGSGGRFAEVRWTRGEEYLELHVRYALGLVTYGWDGEAFSHAEYMRWRQVRGQYPVYGTDPLWAANAPSETHSFAATGVRLPMSEPSMRCFPHG